METFAVVVARWSRYGLWEDGGGESPGAASEAPDTKGGCGRRKDGTQASQIHSRQRAWSQRLAQEVWARWPAFVEPKPCEDPGRQQMRAPAVRQKEGSVSASGVGRSCEMECLVADVVKPLALAPAIVDTGREVDRLRDGPPQKEKGTCTMDANVDGVVGLGRGSGDGAGFHQAGGKSHLVWRGADKAAVSTEEEPEMSEEGESGFRLTEKLADPRDPTPVSERGTESTIPLCPGQGQGSPASATRGVAGHLGVALALATHGRGGQVASWRSW